MVGRCNTNRVPNNRFRFGGCLDPIWHNGVAVVIDFPRKFLLSYFLLAVALPKRRRFKVTSKGVALAMIALVEPPSSGNQVVVVRCLEVPSLQVAIE